MKRKAKLRQEQLRNRLKKKLTRKRDGADTVRRKTVWRHPTKELSRHCG